MMRHIYKFQINYKEYVFTGTNSLKFLKLVVYDNIENNPKHTPNIISTII
jgi:hypothetical protein